MGAAFAAKATPNKIHYRKPKKRNDKPTAILEISTSPSDATLMHYQKGVILERINHIFGEAWINDIKFVALERNAFKPKTKPYKRPLTQGEKNDLSNILENVSDPLIYERLQSLGSHILKSDKS